MSQGAAGFDQAVESYYKAWFRYHPEAAVEAGAPGYARLLTPFGDDERGALVNLNDALIDALGSLPSPRGRRDGDEGRPPAPFALSPSWGLVRGTPNASCLR